MRYRRAFIPGGAFFFTLVTAKRRPLFARADTVELLREAFRVIKGRRPFVIDAIVVMPEHLHCIWTLPPGDADFAIRWRLVKSWFSKRCDPTLRIPPDHARLAKGEQAIWQHRYWEGEIGSPIFLRFQSQAPIRSDPMPARCYQHDDFCRSWGWRRNVNLSPLVFGEGRRVYVGLVNRNPTYR